MKETMKSMAFPRVGPPKLNPLRSSRIIVKVKIFLTKFCRVLAAVRVKVDDLQNEEMQVDNVDLIKTLIYTVKGSHTSPFGN